jgi:uncharacterized protein YbjT (DUF2867 family)
MKIVLTGSLGNISKPLTKELVEKGHRVTVISSKPEKQQAIKSLGATAAIGSIEDVSFLTNTFMGADAVYCMLPPFDYLDPNLDIMANTRKQVRCFKEAILAAGIKKVVHLSSIGAHTNQGIGVLAFHQLAEQLFKELPAEVIIKHMRPVGFYTNLYNYMTMVKGKGFGGVYLTMRYAGLMNLIRGKMGVIAANYGAEDKMPWVSPIDIAAAIAEELSNDFDERIIRYIVSEELTCNEIAKIIGQAVGKPFLQWSLMSDEDMLGGLKMFKIPQKNAEGMVEMNAAMHSAMVYEDYYRNKPKVMGKVKMKDFAKEFALVYNQN